jgi:DNA-binding transcriptional MerR regulator
MGDGSYSIEDLERLLGVKGRTIHYWSHEGLFEGPGAGRGARYTDEHLARLFLIQKLRAEGRPVAEIKAALKRVSTTDLRLWAEQAKAEPPKESVKAKQLITRWLKEGNESDVVVASRVTTPRQSWQRRAVWSAMSDDVPAGHWQRIPFAPDVELHVQHPPSPTSQRLVDQLVALARRLTQEDTP